MIFVLTFLAWFSLVTGGIGLIVVAEPWWNRTSGNRSWRGGRPLPHAALQPATLSSRRASPLGAGEPCLDCA